MDNTEFKIEDLNKEAKMIFGLAPENYPWFCVYEKNGMYSLVENDFGELGDGNDPVHFINIGLPFSYDAVKYFGLMDFDYPPFSYRVLSSARGYIAMGSKNVWDIYCLDYLTGCTKIVDAMADWENACASLRDRIGYDPKDWNDMSHWLKYTPDNITGLEDNQVFVFGSNLEGMHGGGAAYIARTKFGARMGQGVGMQGQSYAIPTMFNSVEQIRPYVEEFIRYAEVHPEKEFLVTRIGCGIARFSDKDIAPLFKEAPGVKNIVLPKSFVDCLF